MGGFLYLTGGYDGDAVTNTLLRAQVLDPAQAPAVLGYEVESAWLTVRVGGGAPDGGPGGENDHGLTGGLWVYRVAARFPLDDPNNPGGESLPGAPLYLPVPAESGGLAVTLFWEPAAGADGYRVYRTPTNDGAARDLQLLAEVEGGDGTTFVDRGDATDPIRTPMPPGSTGVWHVVTDAPLRVAREAHATVAVPDPGDSDRWFLYAVGGRGNPPPGEEDGEGPPVYASGEWTAITLEPGGGQQVAPWQWTQGELAPGRAELAVFVVTEADTRHIEDGSVYLYFGSGVEADGNHVEEVEGVRGAADGDLLVLGQTKKPQPARIGAVGLAANEHLFLFGGAGRVASHWDDSSAKLKGDQPDIEDWHSLDAGQMLLPRIYHAGVEQGAFFYLAGGATMARTGGVTATVEFTLK